MCISIWNWGKTKLKGPGNFYFTMTFNSSISFIYPGMSLWFDCSWSFHVPPCKLLTGSRRIVKLRQFSVESIVIFVLWSVLKWNKRSGITQNEKFICLLHNRNSTQQVPELHKASSIFFPAYRKLVVRFGPVELIFEFGTSQRILYPILSFVLICVLSFISYPLKGIFKLLIKPSILLSSHSFHPVF